MKLYYKAGACSLASHIALVQSGLPFQVEAVDLAAKVTETGSDFTAINPKGYVPALQLDDGTLVTEGVAILLEIAALAPEAHLAPPPGSREYRPLVEWLVFVATELHKTAVGLINPAFGADAKAAVTSLLDRRLAQAERMLGDGPFTLGTTCSVADFYLFTVLSWMPRLGIDLGRWPHLAAFQGRLAALPAVQTTLQAEGLA
jgi:glutathione S-transferase